MKEYNFNGDFELIQLQLNSKYANVSVDLQGVFLEFNLYESIFNSTLSGNIVIADANNLIKKLDIQGGEELLYEFVTRGKSKPISGKLIVYKIDGISELNLSGRGYRLHLVSEEFLTNENMLLSQAHSGTCSEIVQKVFTQLKSEKSLFTEDTKGIYDVVFPNWKPFAAVNWVSKQAISAQDNGGFLFFENNRGFHYYAIESLYQQDPMIKYKRDTRMSTSAAEAMHNFNSIQVLEILPKVDILKKMANGSLAATHLNLDVTTRRLHKTEYNHADKFDASKRLGDIMVDNRLEYDATSTIRFDVSPVDTRNNGHRYKLSNYALKALANTFAADITVAGDSDIGAGVTCEADIPAPEYTEGERKLDRLSGKFLVANVRHTLTQTRYIMTNTIIKDSLNNVE